MSRAGRAFQPDRTAPRPAPGRCSGRAGAVPSEAAGEPHRRGADRVATRFDAAGHAGREDGVAVGGDDEVVPVGEVAGEAMVIAVRAKHPQVIFAAVVGQRRPVAAQGLVRFDDVAAWRAVEVQLVVMWNTAAARPVFAIVCVTVPLRASICALACSSYGNARDSRCRDSARCAFVTLRAQRTSDARCGCWSGRKLPICAGDGGKKLPIPEGDVTPCRCACNVIDLCVDHVSFA